MQRLTSHYHQRLALPSNWKVETVTLSITGKQVERPVCGQARNIDEPCR